MSFGSNQELMNLSRIIEDLRLEKWFISQPLRKSYIFWEHPNIQKVRQVVTTQDNHSSLSFSQTLKQYHSYIRRPYLV